MVATESTMLALGTEAPDFELLDAVSGEMRTLDQIASARPKGLLVMFICNHCPYVKHIADGIAALGRELLSLDIAVVAISSNDAARYPDDSPPRLKDEAVQRGYEFPYLFDETQQVAKRYRAACTPEMYLFDSDRKLVYRGQFDDSRPKNDVAVTGSSVRAAAQALLAGNPPLEEQKASIGCNIKWKPGNEPTY